MSNEIQTCHEESKLYVNVDATKEPKTRVQRCAKNCSLDRQYLVIQITHGDTAFRLQKSVQHPLYIYAAATLIHLYGASGTS